MHTPNEPSNLPSQAPTGVTQGTDLHQSKIPPDDPRLRIDRPRSRTLRKGPIVLVIVLVAFVVAVALVAALSGGAKDTAQKKDQADQAAQVTASMPLPDVIADPPSAATSPDGGVPRARGDGPTAARAGQEPGRAAVDQTRTDELLKARQATLFASGDDFALVQQGPPDVPRRGDAEPIVASASGGGHVQSTSDSGRPGDQNLQDRKNDFLARAGVSDAEYLDKGLTLPRSSYEVKAGTVIPAALITGINSDLPGEVVGQVRENVYDSISGNYLLIPQGSRLLAAYDSMVAWGQERVLLCWNRLIRPDGSSITLDCMPGVDLAGNAGFADQVDNHWWKIIGGAAVSSLLAATAQQSQGNVTGYQPSFPQVWAGGAAANVNQAGQQLTAKNLQIQPTITIRPGFSVNVVVTKDIVIGPYERSEVLR